MPDWKALAERHRARMAAAGPPDVKNVRPSLREFARYVTTHRDEVAVIAERSSSSAPPAAFVRQMERAGAYAISVASEDSLEPLRAAAAVAQVPVLARGIVLDEHDLYRLRNAGADAAVVHPALLPALRMTGLRKAARSMMMELVVEVQDDEDLSIALASETLLIAAPAAIIAKVPKDRTPILIGAVDAHAIHRVQSHLDAVLLVDPAEALVQEVSGL